MCKVWFVVAVVLTASGARSQPSLESQGARSQFVVIVRDDQTKNLIEDFTLSLDEAGADGRTYEEALRCSDMSIVRVLMSQGLWRIRVYGEGYDEEIIDNIRIKDGEVAQQSTYGWGQIQSFKGTTIAVPVNLKRTQNGQKHTTVHPFLSDTTFYDQADTPPEPIGGIEAIRRKIRSKALARKGLAPIHGTFTIVAYINRVGSIVRSDVIQHLEPIVDDFIVQVIRSSKFKPAQILDTPVSSRLSLSFDFKLEPKLEKPGLR